jgi:hypothetical protein
MSLSLGTVRNGTPVLADGDDPLHARRVQRRNGDHQQLGSRLVDHRRRIVQRAEDRQALQLGAAQVRRVVQQADRLEVTGTAQVTDQGLAAWPAPGSARGGRGTDCSA